MSNTIGTNRLNPMMRIGGIEVSIAHYLHSCTENNRELHERCILEVIASASKDNYPIDYIELTLNYVLVHPRHSHQGRLSTLISPRKFVYTTSCAHGKHPKGTVCLAFYYKDKVVLEFDDGYIGEVGESLCDTALRELREGEDAKFVKWVNGMEEKLRISTKSKRRSKCKVYSKLCKKHNVVHGKEAEELRVGIESLLMSDSDDVGDEIQELLDRVEAGDSLAYLEARDAHRS